MRLLCYTSLAQLGLTNATATSLLEITKKMPWGSVFIIPVNNADVETLHSNGVIPVNSAGFLEVYNFGRGIARFTRDDVYNGVFVTATNSTNTNPFVSWRKIATTDV